MTPYLKLQVKTGAIARSTQLILLQIYIKPSAKNDMYLTNVKMEVQKTQYKPGLSQANRDA